MARVRSVTISFPPLLRYAFSVWLVLSWYLCTATGDIEFYLFQVVLPSHTTCPDCFPYSFVSGPTPYRLENFIEFTAPGSEREIASGVRIDYKIIIINNV